MKGREPKTADIERMQRAIALITAYDVGYEDGDFDLFVELAQEEEHPEAIMQTLAQFNWLLLRSLDESGYPKSEILEWYGSRFALAAEETRG